MSQSQYEYTPDGIFKRQGREQYQLTNFLAEITEQTKYHDGKHTETVLTIEGKLHDHDLETITVTAQNFAAMGWVTTLWGVEPVILPIPNSERDVRTAIQYFSRPKTVNVYRTTGWGKIAKKDVYLHAAGAIGEKGNNPKVRVELPHDIQRYRFHNTDLSAKDAFLASISLPAVGPQKALWPMVLAAYRAAIGQADFAIHLAGRTGTFKTELASLIQSHFGPMDARQIPGSWSSTANALEALAYHARHAIFAIDDYVPTGTAWQVKTLNKTADQIIRGQGNQAGRARLSDRTSLQQTYYPRGLILSTGEDVPEGHSIRARMMILEISPGEVDVSRLTKAQERRHAYQAAMQHWISWLAESLQEKREFLTNHAKTIRDQHQQLGHSRTPAMLGELLATAGLIVAWANATKMITQEQAERIHKSAKEALTDAATEQDQFMEESDPADAFVETIKQVTAGHLAHLATKDGQPPEYAYALGWTETKGPGGMPSFKSHGPLLGWVHWENNEVYIDINAIKFLARHAQGKISMTRQTLLKRLKDAGLLTRTDAARQRNAIRVTCQGHPRNVVAIPLDKILEGEEL